MNCRSSLFSSLCALLVQIGCTEDQYLLSIDTDAVTPSQLHDGDSAGGRFAVAAVIDTVRVDVLSPGGAVIDTCQFFLPDRKAWPLSLGIPKSPGGQPVRLRVRGFHGRFGIPDPNAHSSTQCGGIEIASRALTLTEPPAEVTIDRLVVLPAPTYGVMSAHAHLALSCMGVPPDFTDNTTCHRDPLRPERAEETDPAVQDSLAGTSQFSRLVPCDESFLPSLTKMTARCIPGGLSIQGEPNLAGIDDESLEPIPMRVVYLSPFYMDETEFTTERLLALKLRNSGLGSPAAKNTPDRRIYMPGFCTWEGTASDGRLPVNCILPTLAKELCRTDHPDGQFPTEAQWEYSAHGSGQQRSYPWGDVPASCCQASLSRKAPPNFTFVQCPDVGPEPVRSHDGTRCAQGGDVSFDGIFDLGGSMKEMVRDGASRYAARCGLPRFGIGINPLCPDSGGALISRGGYWNSGLVTGFAANRRLTNFEAISGFRCVYPGGSSR